MPIEIVETTPTQDIDGQPAREQVPTNGTTDNAQDSTAQVVQPSGDSQGDSQVGESTQSTVDNTDKPTNGEPAKADVNISPEALRQITALSKSNRTLKAKLTELEGKVNKPNEIVTEYEKLRTRNAELEAALKSPRAWMKLANVDLEAISKDILSSDHEVSDPRVTELATHNAEMRKELDELKNARQTETQRATAEQANQRIAQTVEFVKTKVIGETTLNDGSLRWERISKDESAAQTAVEASIKVVDRDYSELKDAQGNVIRAAKQIDKATATAILHKCLDEAEAAAIAKELLEQRKNGAGQKPPVEARSRGISFRESQAPDETAAPPRKPTIDGSRGPMRTIQVQRGQTNAREAYRRAMRIAGAEDDK